MSRPTLLQMDSALVHHAVWKLLRGPTSTTAWVSWLGDSTLEGRSSSGSNVSRSSLWV